jgi:membrane-bound lytic murein transglycosylase B
VAPRGPWRRAVLVGTVTLALALTATPARADDPVAAARAQARAAETDVRALQAQAQIAAAAYQTALDGMSSAVTTQVQAEQIADQASLDAQDADRTQRRHLQQLYMSGGVSILGITLADGPVAASQGTDYLKRLVVSDHRSVSLTSTEQVRARNVAVSLDRATDSVVSTIDSVEQRYNDVQDLVDRAQARLASLSAEAQGLASIQALIKELDAEKAAADAARVTAAKRATAGGIPAAYLILYRAAALTCPGLPWVVLAAIGQVETGHGSNMSSSSAGAQGPMQFLPGTFAAYAVDGNGDGVKDIHNPADSIFTAAAYLCANHGGRNAAGTRAAIYRYNHANWYVELVLNIAAQIAQRFGEPAPPPYAPVA